MWRMLALLCLLLLSACTAAVPAPVETPLHTEEAAASDPRAIAVCGEAVTFASAPARAIIFEANMLEIMLELGLDDRIAGVWTGDIPAEKVQSAYRARTEPLTVIATESWPPPSLEVVLGADPDFVWSGWGYGFSEESGLTPAKLAEVGIGSYVVSESCPPGSDAQAATGFDHLYQDILAAGQIFGVSERAEALVAALQAEVKSVMDAVGTFEAPLRVFNYDSGEDSPFTSGALGMPHTLITLAGGEHIFADTEDDWLTTSWEEVVARDPEVILVSDSAWAAFDDNVAFLKSLPELADVSAIRNERFIPLTFKQATPGLENVAALRTIAQGLYPDKFAGTASRDSAPAENPQGCVDAYDPNVDYFPVKSSVTYAKLWQIDYAKHYKVIRTSIDSLTGSDGNAAPISQSYVLLQCGAPAPALTGELAGATIIEVPVKNAVATYYEDVTALFELGLADKVVAIPDPVFIAEQGKLLPTPIMAGVAAGTVQQYGEQVSAEVFVALQPGVVFAYSVYGYDDHSTLSTAGVPAVGVLNAAEATPLGDAEWIKFFAAFFNAEADANALFDEVAQNYNDLAAQAAAQSNKPNVMMVSPYSATYFEAHQNSWGARLIEDAGGTNLLAADGPTAPQGISGEVVIQAGYAAQVWLTEFSAFDLAEKRESIATVPFAEFPAVQNKQIWNIGKTDADQNHFYGFWSTRPDLLLQDLVSLLHPTLAPDHQLAVLEPPVNY